jgi:hypothetical protein
LASRKSTGHARLAEMAGLLKRHLQACLRGDLQKKPLHSRSDYTS